MLAQEDQDEAATSSLPAGILGSFTGLKLPIIAKPALERQVVHCTILSASFEGLTSCLLQTNAKWSGGKQATSSVIPLV